MDGRKYTDEIERISSSLFRLVRLRSTHVLHKTENSRLSPINLKSGFFFFLCQAMFFAPKTIPPAKPNQ